MSEESIPSTPSLFQRWKRHWRCAAFAALWLIIAASVVGLGYCGWQFKNQITAQNKQLNQALTSLTQEQKTQAAQLSNQQKTVDAGQSKQQQLAQQIQKLTVTHLSGSSTGGVLSNLTQQVAVIQLLISHQQYSLAINLLATMESELVSLPEAQRQEVMTALVADRERMQQVQTAVQQLLGQLQQLQQHINQQLLLHFGPAVAETKNLLTTPSSPTTENFWAQLQQQLTQAVQVQHISAQANPVLPAFYSGVMLQLALYQAQFALTQGNWMEFQLALNAVQAWLTPATLSWLPDMASVMQTIDSLSQQPPAFSTVNVNATQQALINITGELAQ